jgi:hypothetical protein
MYAVADKLQRLEPASLHVTSNVENKNTRNPTAAEMADSRRQINLDFGGQGHRIILGVRWQAWMYLASIIRRQMQFLLKAGFTHATLEIAPSRCNQGQICVPIPELARRRPTSR